MSCLHHASFYYVSPPQLWPILPGECIYPEWRNQEIAREKSTKYRKGKLLYSSTCNFADREGQYYYRDVFAVLQPVTIII